MFAPQTRDLSHIELAQSDNISSLHEVKAYRVNEVDISSERKNRARIEGIYPFILALFCLYRGLGLAHLRLTSQTRCSHLMVFFKFSAKNIAKYGVFFVVRY